MIYLYIQLVYVQTHTQSSSHAIKALIVSLLITFLSAVFLFLHSLTCPYLPSLSSWERPPSTGDKENRGGGKKEQQQEGMRGDEEKRRVGRLIWRTHTYTGAIVLKFLRWSPVITEAESNERVASLSSSPLFSSPPRPVSLHSKSPLPPCLSEPL